MVDVKSWFQKQFSYLKDSLPEILKGLVLAALTFSGLLVSLILRMLEYNGVIISMGGIAVEAIALIACYFLFRGYLKSERETPSTKKKGKK